MKLWGFQDILQTGSVRVISDSIHVVRRLSIRPSGFAEETSDLEGLGSFHRSESFAAEDLSSQDFRKCCWD